MKSNLLPKPDEVGLTVHVEKPVVEVAPSKSLPQPVSVAANAKGQTSVSSKKEPNIFLRSFAWLVLICLGISEVFKHKQFLLQKAEECRKSFTKRTARRLVVVFLCRMRDEKLATFDNLSFVDNETQSRLRKRVREGLNASSAAMSFIISKTVALLLLSFSLNALAVVSLLLTAPKISNVLIDYKFTSENHIFYRALYTFGCLCAFYALIGFPRKLFSLVKVFGLKPSKKWFDGWCMIFSWISVLIVFLVRLGVVPVDNSVSTFYLLAILVASAGFALGDVLARVIGGAFGKLLFFGYRQNWPAVPMMTFFILELIDKIEKQPKFWGQPIFSHSLLTHIEVIASELEDGLPSLLKSGDNATDTWFAEKSRRQAAYVRSLKRWVLSPMPDTRLHLTEALANLLVRLNSMDWANIAELEASNVSGPKYWYHRILSSAAQLVAAAVPLVGLFGFHKMYPAVDIPASVSVLVFTVSVVQLLSILDPNVNAKITAARDLTQVVLPSTKSDKEKK